MGIERIFKPHIVNSGGYKGGPAAPNELSQKIFKLSSNENYFGTSPTVKEAIERQLNDLNIYPDGTPQRLYETLSNSYGISDQHFIAGNSGSELIQLINHAFLDPDTQSIISNPCFAPYRMFSEWTGGKVIDIPLLQPEYRLNVAGILSSITASTRLIFLTSPNNPTGTYIRKNELEELLVNLPDHVVVVYDEVYHHFADAADYSRALPFVQKGLPLIGLNSFSKAYGMASLRLGYAYTTLEIASYLRKLIRPFLINKLGLAAAIAALHDPAFVSNSAKNIIIERERLCAGLSELGMPHWESQGNFVLVKVQGELSEVVNKMAEEGIMVRSANNFGAPNCIRITIGDQEATDHTLFALASIFK